MFSKGIDKVIAEYCELLCERTAARREQSRGGRKKKSNLLPCDGCGRGGAEERQAGLHPYEPQVAVLRQVERDALVMGRWRQVHNGHDRRGEVVPCP